MRAAANRTAGMSRWFESTTSPSSSRVSFLATAALGAVIPTALFQGSTDGGCAEVAWRWATCSAALAHTRGTPGSSGDTREGCVWSWVCCIDRAAAIQTSSLGVELPAGCLAALGEAEGGRWIADLCASAVSLAMILVPVAGLAPWAFVVRGG